MNSAKRFDYLDFVLIDSPATLLPWQEKSRQLSLLVKQCKYTNKLLFLTGCGVQQLAYYVAMESQHISVINGCEKGGSIKKIKTSVPPDTLN